MVIKLACLVWCPKSALLAFRYAFGENVGAASSTKIWYFCWFNRRWRCFLRMFIALDFLCFLRLFYDRFLFMLSTIHHYTPLVICCGPLFIVWVLGYCFSRLSPLFIVRACINKPWGYWCFLRFFCGRFFFIVLVIRVCINKLRGFWCFFTTVSCSSSVSCESVFKGYKSLFSRGIKWEQWPETA